MYITRLFTANHHRVINTQTGPDFLAHPLLLDMLYVKGGSH